MYSVCPVKGIPDRVTASLLRGAVTMAAAWPERHISVAALTYDNGGGPALGGETAGLPIRRVLQSLGIDQFDFGLLENSGSSDGVGSLQRDAVSDDDETCERQDGGVCQCFENDFWPNSGGIAQGDCDTRLAHA